MTLLAPAGLPVSAALTFGGLGDRRTGRRARRRASMGNDGEHLSRVNRRKR
ncbi:hypothetical protein ACWC09_02830 [Streptomyces sp. NPDC001617]